MNYECHITVRQKDSETAQKIANAHRWKTSEIARDPILGEDTYFYLTMHDADVLALHKYMRNMSSILRMSGVEVVRQKIELTVYDSRAD